MPPASTPTRTALLVERDGQLGDLLAAGLRANGYHATWTGSAAEAERLLRSRPFDLAVVDSQLPEVESARLLRALRIHPAASLLVVAREADGAERCTVDDVVIDRSAHRCWVAGRELTLRLKEFDVLATLLLHCDQLVMRSALMREVWDDNWTGSTKTLDVTVAGLRRHLREAGTRSGARSMPRIATVRGLGYRLESCASA